MKVKELLTRARLCIHNLPAVCSGFSLARIVSMPWYNLKSGYRGSKGERNLKKQKWQEVYTALSESLDEKRHRIYREINFKIFGDKRGFILVALFCMFVNVCIDI